MMNWFEALELELEIICPACGRVHELKVPAIGWTAYLKGELVQNAFPTMSPRDREKIISGLCEDCQAEMYPPELEEEEEFQSLIRNDFLLEIAECFQGLMAKAQTSAEIDLIEILTKAFESSVDLD